MSRIREYTFRVATAALLRSISWIQRRYGVTTNYKVGSDGIAALFENCWFRYDIGDFGATGNIDFHGDGENATRRKLFALLKAGEVFYDVGAHGGVYSVTLKKKFPSLEVHSFEPQPKELLANLALNDMPSSLVHAVALGDQAGIVRMTSQNRSSNHVSSEGDIEVSMVRLDDYRQGKSLAPPAWIKIDIEGLELPALKGSEATIRASRPILICEINELNKRYGLGVGDLVTYVTDLDYTIYRLVDGRLIPASATSSLSDLGPSADFNYWFVPSERGHEFTR